MGTLRAGVAGVGHLGYHHARIYAAMENVELVGAADPSPERREKAAADFGAPGFADLDGLIAAKPDIVSVVTPTEGHHAATMRLLGAGIHVLVEKPIAATSAQAGEMVAAARDAGRILQVGHIERFNAAVQALFEGIHAPRFIECHRLSPYPNRNSDVSVVHDLMIHDLDIVLCLAQSEVVSVDAVGVPVFSSCEDIANARLRFASGCVANLTSSRVSLEGMRKIRIFEDNAYVSTDYSAQQVLVYRKKPGPLPEGENPMASITVDPLPVTREEPLLRELQAFVRAVTLGENPAVTGEDGLRALRLVEDIVEQIRSHR
ncbi:MAG: Gfo/Idh/MocA family oxidoreductase [Candidatus Hydrogenedentes bacterium]|nr:Gfo/Idh/MocA family oxidoreductase [Candidatus Hydrogenedentota bacterium]